MTKKHELTKATADVTPEVVENHPVSSPATDIYRRDDAFVVVADLPGVSEQDLEIHVDRNVLRVTGRTESKAVEDHDLVYQDYEPVVFERSFTLPSDIDREGIKATIKHGVLTLELPKSKQAQPRRIPVKVTA